MAEAVEVAKRHGGNGPHDHGDQEIAGGASAAREGAIAVRLACVGPFGMRLAPGLKQAHDRSLASDSVSAATVAARSRLATEHAAVMASVMVTRRPASPVSR